MCVCVISSLLSSILLQVVSEIYHSFLCSSSFPVSVLSFRSSFLSSSLSPSLPPPPSPSPSPSPCHSPSPSPSPSLSPFVPPSIPPSVPLSFPFSLLPSLLSLPPSLPSSLPLSPFVSLQDDRSHMCTSYRMTMTMSMCKIASNAVVQLLKKVSLLSPQNHSTHSPFCTVTCCHERLTKSFTHTCMRHQKYDMVVSFQDQPSHRKAFL